MSSKDAPVEVALLEIAKDLLQASDDLAATDPSASAKLAHEAYEIGRDLGIVREHLDPTLETAASTESLLVDGSSPMNRASAGSNIPASLGSSTRVNGSSSDSVRAESYGNAGTDSVGGFAPSRNSNGVGSMPRLRDPDDESDDGLFRILDRQRTVVPNHGELAPARNARRNAKQMTFDVPKPRRSGWFSWMRSRDLRHAG